MVNNKRDRNNIRNGEVSYIVFYLASIFFLFIFSVASGQVVHKRVPINSIGTLIGNLNKLNQASAENIYLDSLKLETNDYSIVHYHLESDSLKKLLLFNSAEDIFNDSTNSGSRLLFIKNGQIVFNVPSPPLTHIVYIESSKIIVGLSKIVVSPYNIVVFDLKGKLLGRRTLNPWDLTLTNDELDDLIKKYPGLLNCMNKSVIVKSNDSLIVEITSCLLNTLGREKLIALGKFSPSLFFPLMSSSMHGSYTRYFNSFSDSDPVYDIIMIKSVPYMIVLNSEDGRKVNIPLVSTFSPSPWFEK
jgi:hypothetical protein